MKHTIAIALALLTTSATAEWHSIALDDGGYAAGAFSSKYRNSIAQVAFYPSHQCRPLAMIKILEGGGPSTMEAHSVNIEVRIDDNPLWTAEGTAEKKDEMQTSVFGVGFDFLEEVYYGNVMRVKTYTEGGKEQYDRFSLKGSAKAIVHAVEQCQTAAKTPDPDAEYFDTVDTTPDNDATYF